jgi:NAD(P)-dependent dehydrogenase (short-subunit alcohol dehydrogenase family)
MELKNKVVAITAGAAGIGRECALHLARAGCDIAIADVNMAAAELVVKEVELLGRRAIAVKCDVTSNDDVVAFASAVESKFGGVDILMNHAGVAAAGPIEAVPDEDWRWVFETNVMGVVRCTRAFLPMLKSGSVICNTASSLGLFPEVSVALPYIASKGGIIAMSEALFLQMRPRGIRVMVLAPDITLTAFHFSGRATGIDPIVAGAALPLERQQHPSAVAEAFMSALQSGAFMACNVPNLRAHLVAKAEGIFTPEYRAYPELEAVEALLAPKEVSA